jgi:GT2 family glycosyltransferase
MNSEVSAVIVSYNTVDKLRRCLSCIEPEHEVVVIDNASVDGSADMVEAEFPNVKLIRNTVNEGFAAANNRGMTQVTRPWTLFLNSDAYAEPGAINRLWASTEGPNVCAVGGRLLNPDGSLQNSTANELTLWAVACEQLYLEKLFPNSDSLSPYWNTRRLTGEMETPQVMGACLMMRTGEVLWDERYFLYCEDTDLCRRLKQKTGGRIVYVPDARFTHELGSSSSQSPWIAVARYNRGKELYFSLHHGAMASMVCFSLNRYGALLRMAVWSIANILTLFARAKWRDNIMFWGEVFTVPRLGPPRPGRTA